MKRILRVIILLAVVLIVALVFRVWQLKQDNNGPPGGTGVIEGVDVNVTSRLATRILKINAKEGDMVKEGDVLVELDCLAGEAALSDANARFNAAEAAFEASEANANYVDKNADSVHGTIAIANSQLAALESQEKLAKLELKRFESLFADGAATTASVDAARSKLDTLTNQIAAQRASAEATRTQSGALKSAGSAAKAQILAAKSQIEVAKAAVAMAEINVRECKVIAPRNGIVSSRNFEPGEAVQPGSTILAITDLSEARVRFYVENSDLGAAVSGQPVDIVADAYPGQSFKGTIIYVSPQAEFTPRNVQTRKDRERLVYAVEARVPNTEMRLRSGMPVEVTIKNKP